MPCGIDNSFNHATYINREIEIALMFSMPHHYPNTSLVRFLAFYYLAPLEVVYKSVTITTDK
jgi:hypothetical protein